MPESSLRILNKCGRYKTRSFVSPRHTIFSMAILSLIMGMVMEYWSISCSNIANLRWPITSITWSIQMYMSQVHFCHGQKWSYTKQDWEKSEGGLHGDTIVSIKVRRSIKKLCIQGPTEGNNDIDHLTLHNKRTKFACNPNTFWMEPNDIACYFQSKPLGKATLKEPKEFNTFITIFGSD